MDPKRRIPEAGQESVWDYPRPPRVEPTQKRIRVVFNDTTIADTTHAQRVLETSHPPVYYIPQADVRMDLLTPALHRTFCEFKGAAAYWDLRHADRESLQVAWSYPTPNPAYSAIQNHLAFYPGRVDACYVDDEQVKSQEGDFYGGWITSNIVGPFKGAPGTRFW